MAKQRPKDKGTKAETDVVNWARSKGFHNPARIVQYGNKDHGDVQLAPNIMAQIKDGYTEGREPSDYLIGQWLGKLDEQKKHGGWEHTVLVHKRKGKGSPDDWRWYIDGPTFARLTCGTFQPEHVPVYVQLQGYMVAPLLLSGARW